MPSVKTWQLIAGSAVAGLALSVAAVAAAGPWDSGQRKAERDRAASWGRTGGADHGGGLLPEAAPSAPGGARRRRPRGPARGGRRRRRRRGRAAAALKPLLADPALGTVRTASVVDTATGQVLYESGARDAMTPASTVKIVTAAAALAALGPSTGSGPASSAARRAGADRARRRRRPLPHREGRESPAGSGRSLVPLAADTAQALKAAGTAAPVTLG